MFKALPKRHRLVPLPQAPLASRKAFLPSLQATRENFLFIIDKDFRERRAFRPGVIIQSPWKSYKEDAVT